MTQKNTLISSLQKRLQEHSVTRFAPSPSGFLHIGHIASALYVWGIAHKLQSKIILRIEDHDRLRSKTVYKEAIFEDLEWLGFTYDSSYCQSERLDHYKQELVKLREQDLSYPCYCSRKEINARTVLSAAKKNSSKTSIKSPIQAQTDELHYDSYCKNQEHAKQHERTSSKHSLRLCIKNQAETFWEAGKGLLQQNPFDQCGDFVLKDKNDNYSYHFANVLDDLSDGVNLIIRGTDILNSTGRQIYLRSLLSQNTDLANGITKNQLTYFHHPLIMSKINPEEKLAKSKKDVSIKSLREAGTSKEELFALVFASINPAWKEQTFSFSRWLNYLEKASF